MSCLHHRKQWTEWKEQHKENVWKLAEKTLK